MTYDYVTEVVIFLRGDALKAAKREIRRTQGLRASWRFKGPHFRATAKTNISVAVGASTVNVGWATDDAAGEYIYPLHSVSRIKTIAI